MFLHLAKGVRTVLLYLTKDDVELLSSKSSIHLKLHAVVDLCFCLKLHLPSEPSSGIIVRTILKLSQENATAEFFFATLAKFKHLLRLKCRGATKESLPYVNLPTNPDELPPSVYKILVLQVDEKVYINILVLRSFRPGAKS